METTDLRREKIPFIEVIFIDNLSVNYRQIFDHFELFKIQNADSDRLRRILVKRHRWTIKEYCKMIFYIAAFTWIRTQYNEQTVIEHKVAELQGQVSLQKSG